MTSENGFDFRHIDNLPNRPAGLGRLHTCTAAGRGDTGPALLFVHGAHHGAWCYAPYMEFFAERDMACHALDLPGHGGLPQDAAFPGMGIRDMARAVVQACDLLARPLVLVGHSMGALPTLLAAAQRPPAGIVLLSPSPPANVPGAQKIAAVEPGRLRPPPGEQELRRRFLAVDASVDVAPVMRRLCPESPEAINDRFQLRVAVDPATVRVPGLCLEAGLDVSDRHPPGQDRALADFFRFEHALLPDHAHCMQYAPNWRVSAHAVLDWYLARQADSHWMR